MSDLFLDSGAEFSPCGRYRGMLWRRWDDRPPLAAIMLNPSTADAEQDDPTVHRVVMRARMMGFGGLRVGNIFTLRATDPAELRRCADPIGPNADLYLARICDGAGMIICGWGNHGALPGRRRPRCQEVIDLLFGEIGHTLHALRLTNEGQPAHPLYISYGVKPYPWMSPGMLREVAPLRSVQCEKGRPPPHARHFTLNDAAKT